MYGRWTLTWALALLISAPSFSFAQDAGEKAAPEKSAEANEEGAEEKAPEASATEEESSEEEASEEKKDEATEAPAEEAATEEAPAEEAATEEAPAEEAATEEAPAEEATTEETPAEEPAPEAPATDTTSAGMKAAESDVAKEATEETKATTEDGKAKVDAMKKDAAAQTTGEAKDGKTKAGNSDAADQANAVSGSKDKSKSTAAAAAALGAGMAVDPSKPWLINATFEQTLGQGAFVKDRNQGRVPYGYAIFLGGSYDITKLLEGTLRATARISMDQALTTTSNDAGVRPRQFFMRDLSLGLSGLGLYTEKVTGIRFNGRVGALLPTSIQSRAAERYLSLSVGGTAIKTFRDVGPGNLTFVVAETFQKNIAPAKPTSNLEFCDSVSRIDGANCYSALTNPSYSFFHTVNAIYGIGSFNFSLGLTLIQSVQYDISDSESGNGQVTPTGTGVGARPGITALSNTTWGTVSASYVINSNFSVAAGWATIQSPLFQDGNNPRAIRFPWWNFQDPSYSRTSFFLDVNFLY